MLSSEWRRPPPSVGADFPLGAYVGFSSAQGAASLSRQASVELRIPSSVLPSGTDAHDLTVMRYDDGRWVTVSDSVRLNDDRSFTLRVWTTESGIFVIARAQ